MGFSKDQIGKRAARVVTDLLSYFSKPLNTWTVPHWDYPHPVWWGVTYPNTARARPVRQAKLAGGTSTPTRPI